MGKALLAILGGPIAAGVVGATARFYWHRHLERRAARRG